MSFTVTLHSDSPLPHILRRGSSVGEVIAAFAEFDDADNIRRDYEKNGRVSEIETEEDEGVEDENELVENTVIAVFNRLGLPYTPEFIESIQDELFQRPEATAASPNLTTEATAASPSPI